MRLSVCFLMLVAALGAAEQKPAPAKPAPAKKAARAQAARTPLGVPAGAVETAPGIWTWTDSRGKKWTYTRTPFGFQRTAQEPAKAPAAAAKSAATPLDVPAGAVETAPGSWTWTDPQGKKWTYIKTPFGVQRTAQEPRNGAAAAPGPAAASPGVPAGAVETAPGAWTWTDPQGKKWIYTKTPFGFQRTAQEPPNEPSAAKPAAHFNVFDEGENLRFELPSPFGLRTWRRKKTELTEEEKAAWDRSRAAAPAPGRQE